MGTNQSLVSHLKKDLRSSYSQTYGSEDESMTSKDRRRPRYITLATKSNSLNGSRRNTISFLKFWQGQLKGSASDERSSQISSGPISAAVTSNSQSGRPGSLPDSEVFIYPEQYKSMNECDQCHRDIKICNCNFPLDLMGGVQSVEGEEKSPIDFGPLSGSNFSESINERSQSDSKDPGTCLDPSSITENTQGTSCAILLVESGDYGAGNASTYNTIPGSCITTIPLSGKASAEAAIVSLSTVPVRPIASELDQRSDRTQVEDIVSHPVSNSHVFDHTRQVSIIKLSSGSASVGDDKNHEETESHLKSTIRADSGVTEGSELDQESDNQSKKDLINSNSETDRYRNDISDCHRSGEEISSSLVMSLMPSSHHQIISSSHSPKKSRFQDASQAQMLEYLEDAREIVPDFLMTADELMAISENEVIVLNHLEPNASAMPISIVGDTDSPDKGQQSVAMRELKGLKAQNLEVDQVLKRWEQTYENDNIKSKGIGPPGDANISAESSVCSQLSNSMTTIIKAEEDDKHGRLTETDLVSYTNIHVLSSMEMNDTFQFPGKLICAPIKSDDGDENSTSGTCDLNLAGRPEFGYHSFACLKRQSGIEGSYSDRDQCIDDQSAQDSTSSRSSSTENSSTSRRIFNLIDTTLHSTESQTNMVTYLSAISKGDSPKEHEQQTTSGTYIKAQLSQTDSGCDVLPPPCNENSSYSTTSSCQPSSLVLQDQEKPSASNSDKKVNMIAHDATNMNSDIISQRMRVESPMQLSPSELELQSADYKGNGLPEGPTNSKNKQNSDNKFFRRRKDTLFEQIESGFDCVDCHRHIEMADPPLLDPDLGQRQLCIGCRKRRLERKEVISEFVETEIKYGQDLKIIYEEIYKPTSVIGLMTSDQMKGVFLNLDDLMDVNHKLCRRMQEALIRARELDDSEYNSVNIGQIFLESSQMLPSFKDYCIRQGSASCLLARLTKEKPLLKLFLMSLQMENSNLRKMNLAAFLMVPVQRVCKYPLLLERLYKATPYRHKDREALRSALDLAHLHLAYINKLSGNSSRIYRVFKQASPYALPYKRRALKSDNPDYKNSIELLGHVSAVLKSWTRDEIHIAHVGPLHIANLNECMNRQKTKYLRYTQSLAVLVARGQPNDNYRPNQVRANIDVTSKWMRQTPGGLGFEEVALILFRETKTFKLQLIRDPLLLSRCVFSKDYSQLNYDPIGQAQYTPEVQNSVEFVNQSIDNAQVLQSSNITLCDPNICSANQTTLHDRRSNSLVSALISGTIASAASNQAGKPKSTQTKANCAKNQSNPTLIDQIKTRLNGSGCKHASTQVSMTKTVQPEVDKGCSNSSSNIKQQESLITSGPAGPAETGASAKGNLLLKTSALTTPKSPGLNSNGINQGRQLQRANFYNNHSYLYNNHEESYEIHDIYTKETLLIRGETPSKTRVWFHILRYHSKDLGKWRGRRNGVANFMMICCA